MKNNNTVRGINCLDHMLDPETTKGPKPAALKKPEQPEQPDTQPQQTEADPSIMVLDSIKTNGMSILKNTVELQR